MPRPLRGSTTSGEDERRREDEEHRQREHCAAVAQEAVEERIVGSMRNDGSGCAVDAEPAMTSTTGALVATRWATMMTTPAEKANPMSASTPRPFLETRIFSTRVLGTRSGRRHGWRAMRRHR